jgi:ABC-type uncharacterized transport system substrate-binding protein
MLSSQLDPMPRAPRSGQRQALPSWRWRTTWQPAGSSPPEGNTTGVAIFAFQLDVKRLELLHEALPEARRIGILADREQVPIISALNVAARDFGIEISHFTARS